MGRPRKITRANSDANIEQMGFNFPRGYWLHFFLGLLAAYSLYLVVVGSAARGHLPVSMNIMALFDAGASSLLIVIFSVSFLIYAGLKRSMPVITKVCAHTLVILAALALITAFVFTSKPSSSADDFYFVFFVLFHNPWVAIINSIVSLAGIITLAVTVIRRGK